MLGNKYEDTYKDFYPRPPRGGRPSRFVLRWLLHQISIHALREEGDQLSRQHSSICTTFLSTPSARRATSVPASRKTAQRNFYPRPPRGGRHVRSTKN